MKVARLALIAVVAGAVTVSGCATGQRGDRGLFGGSAEEVRAAGVNEYLWRATLDTLEFMPLESADPFGGTYVSEWHAAPERPDERFKVQVFILDTRLRADGISVRVFRQVRQAAGGWVDASVDPDTPVQIENSILTRARQLRIADLDGQT